MTSGATATMLPRMTPGELHWEWLPGALILLVSIVLAVLLLRTLHWRTQGVNTAATVLSSRTQLYEDRNPGVGPEWVTRVEHYATVAYQDSRGEQHVTEIRGDHSVGESVQVLYLPESPERAVSARSVSVGALLVGATVLLAWLAFMLYLAERTT
ncbi:hypothetical protein GCM10010452_33240 [Crossiella cryophila]